MRTYAINKTCRPSRTVSRTTLASYPHLKSVSEQLHLSGGRVYLVIRRNFDDASNDVHVIAGKSGAPIAKRNCFGWYVMWAFASKQGERSSAINSIDVGIVDVLEDMKKLLTQDMLGVRPTELCTCRDNDLKENKFIKSIAESTQIVEGRMLHIKEWFLLKSPLRKKDCLEIVESKVQKLLVQDFVVEIPPKNVNHV